jgi:flagellar biosynthetic protein FlhB
MLHEVSLRLTDLGGPRLTMEGSVWLLSDSIWMVTRTVLPATAFVGAAGLAASLVQTGFVYSPAKLNLDFTHLNPVVGIKNVISWMAVVKLLVGVAKLAVIGLIAYYLIRDRQTWLFASISQSPEGILENGRQLCFTLLARICIAALAIAALDYAYQRWQYEKNLMMTKTEMKEEHKRDEGRPEVKGRMAQMRRQVSRARMMQAVPKADVVVTNPTHYAVALKWDDKEMSAPTVLAKGKDLMAQRIKEVAREHGVPIIERQTLAQILYQTVEVGMEIPPKLYYAVAEVLAFVMRQKPGMRTA